MQITRFDAARPYEAPGHAQMAALRLQGADASEADFAWVGLSHFLPGGSAEMGASPFGKIYVMLEGELVVGLAGGVREVLRKLDSCFLMAGEAREISNESNAVASMLVITPSLGSR